MELFYVMWALCVASLDLPDLHDIVKHIREFQLACWGVQQGHSIGRQKSDPRISNKSKANMRLDALLLLLRRVMGEDHLKPGIREQPGQQGSPP